MNQQIAVAFLIFYFCTGCQPEEPNFDPFIYDCETHLILDHPKSDVYQNYIDSMVVEGLPGISMLIKNDQGLWLGSSGKAELEFKTEMKPCNQHMLGSTTKTFTANIIFQLYEEGLLDLDDKISQYLSDDLIGEIANSNTITIRQLLSHQSGLADYLDISYTLNYYNNITRVWTDKEELSLIYGKDAVFEPGEFVNYSNTNYLLLGMIAKELTNKTGNQLYKERIFDRLGMDNTHFNEMGNIPESLVRGYYDENGKGNMIDITDRAFAVHSMAGGASSNIEDLYKFLQSSWQDEILISDAMKEKVINLDENPPFLEPDKFSYGDNFKVKGIRGIGLCWFVYDTDHGVGIGHDGGFDGRRCVMRYFPSSQSTIIYMINGSGESIKHLLRELRRNGVVELTFEK